MALVKIERKTLVQTPYGFAGTMRVDPTYQGVRQAIADERFSRRVMGKDYAEVVAEIRAKTSDLMQQDLLMREYHNERIAWLVMNAWRWLKKDKYPITVNQFNEVIEGNHRFRAIRYFGLAELMVRVAQESQPVGHAQHPEIW